MLRRSPLAPFNANYFFPNFETSNGTAKGTTKSDYLPPLLLLSALRFLGQLYIFHHFVIIFSLIKSRYVVEEWHTLQIPKWLNTTKKCAAEIASLQKIRFTQEITPDALAKNHFLWFTLRIMRISKYAKWKWSWSLTMFCKLLHPCCFIYWGFFSAEQVSLPPISFLNST